MLSRTYISTSASKRVPSPTASPIHSQRPMSSTPYQHAKSGAEADVSSGKIAYSTISVQQLSLGKHKIGWFKEVTSIER